MDLGVTPDTVRYYTRAGLLEPVRNPTNSYKEYGKQDRQRLGFILSARLLVVSRVLKIRGG
jgi:MerR family Zn(II)-responsive transcriptional regulator of zntA